VLHKQEEKRKSSYSITLEANLALAHTFGLIFEVGLLSRDISISGLTQISNLIMLMGYQGFINMIKEEMDDQ
jgi:hypothetical protein